MTTSKSKIWSRILTIIFFVLFYAPLLSVIIFSFNSTKSATSWGGGFTFKWYQKLFTSQRIIEIVITTLSIAIISTFCSIVIGTLASIGLTKIKKNHRNRLLQVNNFPITNPDIVTAIGLLLLFVTIGVERGYGTMLLAHISFCTPFVIVTIYPKIKSLDPNLIEAAMDLGATPTKAIKSAILPQIKTSIFAAAAISFTMSFDDFVISYFTGGKSLNISTFLYSAKKFNPTFNALSTIIMLVIVIKIVVDKIVKRKAVDDEYLDSKPGQSSFGKKLLIALVAIVLIASPFWLKRYAKDTIYIFNCGEYIDDDSIDGVDLISQFEEMYNCRVVYNTFDSNEAAISKLETESYDVVVPSEYAIEQLIQDDKLLEIDWSRIEGFTKDDITEPLLNILNDLNEQESGYDLLKYGVPYFFGSVGIVYNKAAISEEQLDTYGWDIFRNYTGRVAFYDSSRDGYMVALKALGYSMNTSNLDEIKEATAWLKDMKNKTKCAFKTDELLDDMPENRYDLTFMYSGDANYVIQLAEEKNVDLGYYVPESGTNIFCDAMVIPKDASNVDLAYKFISFMCDEENALANSEYVCYSSSVNSAYEAAISEDGAFADYSDIYEVIYNKEADEIFRYNKTIKAILTGNWAELKI